MSDNLRIITNNQPRLILDWDQLTTKEQADFDYLSEDERVGRDFVRYRGIAYDLGDFMRATGDQLKGWDGYHGDSYFSAVLVRYARDGNLIDHDRVVMALALA
ncbi:MAG: hypothetical protein KGI27_13380 [Thaumarchaeota archaeon]|nr:hypothetical protein [Nitrososphaerota archaeon]